MSVIAPSLMKGPKKFGDPFMLPSTESFPKDIKSTLDLCLYLYGSNRLYGAVCNRVVSHFNTDIEFVGDGNKEEREKLRKCLVSTMGIFSKLQQAGQEWAIYGNAFVRCVEPFDRWLIDTREGKYRAIALSMFPEHLVEYNWENMTYTVPDLVAAQKLPKDRRKVDSLPKVTLEFRDKPSAAPDRFSVVFLDPRYVELDKAHHSDSIEYIYRIPPDMESRIKQGSLHQINNTSRGLLEAVAKSKDFKFHKGEVYHFRSPTPTGVSDSGWSVPEILLHYNALYQLQIYRKADFAVAQDFLLPMRVFTPNFGEKASDTVMTMLMSQWQGQMKNMISTRRKDPTAIHALPFPANYEEYGGQGKQMVLHDVVEVYTDALFDGLGFPRELFRGSVTTEQIPNAIRMFERHYDWMYQGLSGMLEFVSNTVQRAFDSELEEVKLERPSVAHNAEFLQLRMQLAANREIPRQAVYKEVGIGDATDAAVAAIQEDQDIQRKAEEMAAKYEKEKQQGSMADVAIAAAEQGAAAGAPAAGDAPGGGGLDYSVDANADPSMVQQRAQDIGAQWLAMHEQAPNSHRKEMQSAEAINPTLYAAAKDAMEKMRSQGASQGRAQASQLLAGGQ